MPEAITDTSPLLYLHRIGTLNWLRELFSAIVVPAAVVRELQEGRERGYDVPDPADHAWLQVAVPAAVPLNWLALDLGRGSSRSWLSGWRTGGGSYCWMTVWRGGSHMRRNCKSGGR
jgi:hypothetical protein